MIDKNHGGVHWSFWVIGAAALIWNFLGALNFVWQMNADSLASFHESARAIVEGRPAWATGGFAISVFGGMLGCLLLLLGKPAAFHVFIASLLGTIVTMTHTLGLKIDFNASEILLGILMPLAMPAFLVWYSKWAERQGWLRREKLAGNSGPGADQA